MFCGKCGGQLADGADFCGACGAPRNPSTRESITVSGRNKNMVVGSGTLNQNSNNRKTTVKIGSILFIGALLFAGVFFMRDNFIGESGGRGGMPVGRYYMHDGDNFVDEMLSLMIFEFAGRGQGTQHLPGVGVPFEYRIDGNRLIITMHGGTLEYTLGEDRESFFDATGIVNFVRRQ